ncbi:HlyD family type I secretion periplasmic adaptor subunit [Stutzerimonas stutzeri]|uniref:HlyD family type I secretion periplasmic adaptor subunit n=1 Tax=Stutzerimonas stutzeri TaxID=316 RepID=UPI0002DD7CED|nr:HlyD family type I secretion periplasmic adaptor subunit [Stutzerimonas stutzeri]
MSHLPESSPSPLDGLLARAGAPSWRPRERWLALLILAALAWTFIGRIDQVVTAPGKVIPQDKVKIVQHLEGGIVKRVIARENTVVNAGDALLELDLATGGINLSEMNARMAALQFAKARLEAESKGTVPVFPEDLAKQFPDVAEAERWTYKARRDELAGALDALSGQSSQGRQRVTELQAKLAALKASLKLAAQELAVSEDLVKDKLTSQLEHFQRKNAVERLKGEVAMTQQAIPGAQAGQNETDARRREEEARFRRRAADELGEMERKLASLQQELARANRQEDRALIRAPIDGVVRNVRYQSTGNVVKPGEPIMEIVPLGEELVIEVNLNPSDRGYVSLNQPALVKISAYDYFRYGGLEGRVTAIAADTDTGKNEEHFYRVTISTTRAWLGTTPGQFPITPGMVGEVDIKAQSQSIFWLLIKPVLKLKHEAFREV